MSGIELTYLSGYPAAVLDEVRGLLARRQLGPWLLARYPDRHPHRSGKALYAYAIELKTRHMRQAPALAKVVYDPRLELVRNALGTHQRAARVHGSRLSARNEIRIAAVFRQAPQAFLDMILVHELAHLKEPDHGRAFYQLCRHMLPDYDQLELHARIWLTHLELVGELGDD